MWRTALPEQRKRSGQLLGTAALMSFCFGVIEPVELLFAFAAWPLCIAHALLTGTSLALVNASGIKEGFVFSAGALDFGLNFSIATRPLLLLLIAVAYAAIYYVLFKWAILRFNLPTPGRSGACDPATDDSDRAVHRPGPHIPPAEPAKCVLPHTAAAAPPPREAPPEHVHSTKSST
ncbi:PTS transporter subunit EIIC [Streptomyces ardesiacus]|uniref:PTS transporter subunit EIIC n=1 Tax=Streptomyces ardesiacus TaxID=285564 RepID=UPI0036AE4F0A